MNTGGDLADTSLHTSLITQIGDVLAAFTDDYASILGADKSSESKGVLTGRGRGTRGLGGNWKADDKVSDHRWNYQKDGERTGFTGNLAGLGVGGHGEEGEEEEGRRGGKRKKGDGVREEVDWEEIRMADKQQDTTQRGSTSLVHPRTPFFWVAAAKFLTQPSVRVRQWVQNYT